MPQSKNFCIIKILRLRSSGPWTANKYRTELGLTWYDVKDLDRKKLKSMIKEWNTCQWKEELDTKISLRWYKEGKPYIGYDGCYRNNKNSEYLVKARTKTLQLEEHLGRGKNNYDKNGKLCSLEEENLEHFLVKCSRLVSHRDSRIWKNGKY